MKILAVLVGAHRVVLPPHLRSDGRIELTYAAESVTLADVMKDLHLPPETPRIVFLDGNAIQDDQTLRDGQTVTFVSPIGGG